MRSPASRGWQLWSVIFVRGLDRRWNGLGSGTRGEDLYRGDKEESEACLACRPLGSKEEGVMSTLWAFRASDTRVCVSRTLGTSVDLRTNGRGVVLGVGLLS